MYDKIEIPRDYGIFPRLQSDLEKQQDEYHVNKQKHQEAEQELLYIRGEFQNKHSKVTDESRKLENLRKEMDNAALRLFYLKTAKKDIRGDIAIMRRAAEKAVEDLYKVRWAIFMGVTN